MNDLELYNNGVPQNGLSTSSILANAFLSIDGTKVLNMYDKYSAIPFNGVIIPILPSFYMVDDIIYFNNPDKFGGGYIQRSVDFNTVSPKIFGCVCDGVTPDHINFQIAVNTCAEMGYKLDITGLKIKLNETILFNSNLLLSGNVRSTVLDFSSITSGKDYLLISDGANVNGFVFDGARIIGNLSSGSALRLNKQGVIDLAVTDCSFKNLRIESSGIGLKGAYSQCNIFENIRFQGCTKPFELGPQFNNTEFIRCSFVSHSATNTMTNCEGINFTSCNHANCTATSHINSFQSYFSLINYYAEKISNNFITVGSSNQVNESSCTLIGGKSTDSLLKIQLAGDRCPILIKNPSPNSRVIVYDGIANLSPSKYTTRLEVDSSLVKSDNFLIKWDAMADLNMNPAFGGGLNVRTINSISTSIVKNNTDTFNGILLSNSLVVGNPYVIVYSMRKTLSNNTISLRHGTISSQVFKINEPDEEFETRYLPFIAKDVNMAIIWAGRESIEFNFIGITKNEFPSDITKSSVMKSNTFPSIGSYSKGDTIVQSSPSGGVYSGWQCAASGSPGIWRPTGQIGEISGTTAARPSVSIIGYYFFDITINKPIWWNGTVWKDGSGITV
ncbi:hypothetical protein [Pedobacter antarcticus]|uniref:hypothetical protein n=1 Tax=Pedobacter antarcticus TaxID=34086 RepID=UPI0029316A5C|nr:hypothetical protein [Pedobacter antarcticus]